MNLSESLGGCQRPSTCGQEVTKLARRPLPLAADSFSACGAQCIRKTFQILALSCRSRNQKSQIQGRILMAFTTLLLHSKSMGKWSSGEKLAAFVTSRWIDCCRSSRKHADFILSCSHVHARSSHLYDPRIG